MPEPKLHLSEDGMWVILDQPSTPFWWARFLSEEHARLAWAAYHSKR